MDKSDSRRPSTDLSIEPYPEYLSSVTTQCEKIPIKIFNSAEEGSKQVSSKLIDLIQKKRKANQPCILGLSTGSSPLKVYEELIRTYEKDKLSFSHVVTFNLDEYYGIAADDTRSYHRFMQKHLFDFVDIPPKNIHIPDGSIPMEELTQYCADFETKIMEYGGLDLQLLGIGRNGHIGFNEPGSPIDTTTHLADLHSITAVDAGKIFGDFSDIPDKALTMGVGTILMANEILLLAWGSHKAEIVQKAIEGDIDAQVPASYLQNHRNTTFYLDLEAAINLTRVSSPWLVGDINWTEDLITQAKKWLSEKENKLIGELTVKDYRKHSLDAIYEL